MLDPECACACLTHADNIRSSFWGGCLPQPRSSLAVTILVSDPLAHHLPAEPTPCPPERQQLARSFHGLTVTISLRGSIHSAFFQTKISGHLIFNVLKVIASASKVERCFSPDRTRKWGISYNNAGHLQAWRQKPQKRTGNLDSSLFFSTR